MMYLDITRLTTRINNATPTGIDKVELQYALFFLAQGAFFVVQRGDALVQIPNPLAEEIIGYLNSRWQSGQAEDVFIGMKFKAWFDSQPKSQRRKSPEFVFYQEFIKLTLSQRLARIQQEKDDIKKKAPFIPVFMSCFFVALFPWIIKFFVDSKTKIIAANYVNFFLNQNIYINVGHTGLEKKELFSLLHKLNNLKLLFYIHDIMPITHHQYYPSHASEKHKKAIGTVISVGDYIYANSRFTASELCKNFNTSATVDVLEIGAPDKDIQYPMLGRSGFVAIGTIEPRKNYIWLINAWLEFCALYPQEVGSEQLMIFGKRGWLEEQQFNQFQHTVGQSSNISWICDANDEAVTKQLQQARACLAAASVEGWGMPIAESLAYGTPVIASDIAAHREVSKGKAYFYQALNTRQFHEALRSCFVPDEYEKFFNVAGEFIPWGWNVHFERLNAISSQFR